VRCGKQEVRNIAVLKLTELYFSREAVIRNPLVENEDVPDVKPIGWKKIKEEA
ncbi:unnamed protein product, partial [Orchesella dallaii]